MQSRLVDDILPRFGNQGWHLECPQPKTICFFSSGSFSMCSRARAAIDTFSKSLTLEALDSDHMIFSERSFSISILGGRILYNMSEIELDIEFTTFTTINISSSLNLLVITLMPMFASEFCHISKDSPKSHSFLRSFALP